MALWVCWGRVFAGCHYPFDTFGGFLVAAFVTLITYNLLLLYF
jgi:membrane-associated phospholipid phosphatase